MEKKEFIEQSVNLVVEYFNRHIYGKGRNMEKINVVDVEIEDMECIDNDKKILLYVSKVPDKLFEIRYDGETNTLASNILKR